MQNTPAIRVENLHFAWHKGQPTVLNIPELVIAAGEHVFIQGASGSGKSTLLNLLAGVNQPQQGQISILDEAINQLSAAQRDHFRADHIGFVFQLFNLIPYLSVLENVTLPCRFSKQRQHKATANSSLEQEAVRLLKHLGMANKKLLQRPVTELSVGQQQRVATARALIGSPEIIIADEPTSALDSDMRQDFIELLFAECANTNATLLFVSHDQQLQGLFSRQIALADINR
jgi:putative ABC transport system ATP-binding protein